MISMLLMAQLAAASPPPTRFELPNGLRFWVQEDHSLSTTADFRNVPATVQAIREAVAGVGARGVEGWELKEAQAFVLGRTLLYGAREDSPPGVVAAALTESAAVGVDLLDLPALSRAYLGITLDDINRVARTYYRADGMKVVIAGFDMRTKVTSPFAPGTFRALFEP